VKPLLVFCGALAALALAGCSAGIEKYSPDAGWFSKPLVSFNTPDWGSRSRAKERLSSRPVGAEDLLTAEGACPDGSPPVAAAPETPPDAAAPTAAGIALDMTECEVVRRAGTPQRFEVASTEGGERSVVLTYQGGARPGIYRFLSGRLVSIERAGDAPAPAKQRQVKRGAG